MLSVQISTCRCSSCSRKSFRAKNTAPSSKWFMCHRLWGSNHSPKAGMPWHTAPRPRVGASVVTTTPSLGEPPRLKKSLCHGLRALMQPRETAMHNSPKSTPSKGLEISAKTAAGACVVNCPVWNGAGKTKWRPTAPERGERASPPLLVEAHSQIHYRLIHGARMLLHISTHSLRNSKWRSSLSIWLACPMTELRSASHPNNWECASRSLWGGGESCGHALRESARSQSQPKQKNRVLVRCALESKPQKASVIRCYLNVKVRVLKSTDATSPQ